MGLALRRTPPIGQCRPRRGRSVDDTDVPRRQPRRRPRRSPRRRARRCGPRRPSVSNCSRRSPSSSAVPRSSPTGRPTTSSPGTGRGSTGRSVRPAFPSTDSRAGPGRSRPSWSTCTSDGSPRPRPEPRRSTSGSPGPVPRNPGSATTTGSPVPASWSSWTTPRTVPTTSTPWSATRRATSAPMCWPPTTPGTTPRSACRPRSISAVAAVRFRRAHVASLADRGQPERCRGRADRPAHGPTGLGGGPALPAPDGRVPDGDRDRRRNRPGAAADHPPDRRRRDPPERWGPGDHPGPVDGRRRAGSGVPLAGRALVLLAYRRGRDLRSAGPGCSTTCSGCRWRSSPARRPVRW